MRAQPKEINLTKRAIEALPAPAKGRDRYLDEKVRGLGVLVQPTGHKSFFWFRKVRGYPRWETLGQFPDLSVEQARDAAEKLNNKLATWKANRYETDNPFERRDAVTFGRLVEEYVSKQLREHAKHPEAAEPVLRRLVRRHMKDWLALPLERIRREDVAALHREIGEKHHRAANVVVERITAMFNFAEREGLWTGANPARHIQKYHEPHRTRFLQPAEFPALGAALARTPSRDLRDAVGLALLTGARESNLLSMRWEDVSFDDNSWRILDTKNRVPYVIPLSPEAVAILKARLRYRAGGNPWVFPSRGKTGHVVDLGKRWKEALKDAGLANADLRWHDLRRTQGSIQAAQGASLLIIGKSLGHASTAATAIYSQVNLDAVRASMEQANKTMASMLRKKPKLLAAAPKQKKAAG